MQLASLWLLREKSRPTRARKESEKENIGCSPKFKVAFTLVQIREPDNVSLSIGDGMKRFDCDE